MNAVDTNVLVRLVVDDDPEQAARAKALFETGRRRDAIYIPIHVLCEVDWVLRRAYKVPRSRRLQVLLGFVTASGVACDREIVMPALARYEKTKVDFADAVILEQSARAGCLRFYTFDAEILAAFARSKPAARAP